MSEVIVFSDRNLNAPTFHRIAGGNGIIRSGEALPRRTLIGFSVIGCLQEKKITVFGRVIGYVKEKKVFVFGGRIQPSLNAVVGNLNNQVLFPVDLPFLKGLCVNPYGLPTFKENVSRMLFPMLRPNLMSYGSLVILVSAIGQEEDLINLGQTFHTLSQQWELIPKPEHCNQSVSFVVLVHDSTEYPYLLFGFSGLVFGFYSIWQRAFVQTTFNLEGLAQIPNWEERSNLGGVEVVYSFSQGILVVVDLATPLVSNIDMHALLDDYYRADDVEACLLAADGKLHLVWSPEHLQPNLGCLIVWSTFRVIRGELEFSVIDFALKVFVVDDPARLTAVEFALL